MGKSTPAAPAAPDPTVVANAQSQANIDSATAQQKLNMIGTNGPTGSTSYTADPSQPGGYTQNTTLSPSQQAIYDQSTQAQSGALGIANTQLGRVSTALGQGLDPSGVQTSLAPTQGLQSNVSVQNTYNPGQQVQGQVGAGDFNASEQAAANAVYGQETSRLDPQWALAQTQQNDALANQGLGANSTAYQNQQAILGRNKNDAYASAQNDAVQAGQAVQAQGYGQQLSSGQFANAAAGQENAQNLSAADLYNAANLAQASFVNAAQQQQNQQNLQAAQFDNTANAQQFSQNAQAQEQPINEFNSLLSSGQVQAPAGVTYTPSQVGQTDVTGAYALNSQAQQANYQAQLKAQQSGLGGLFSLGSAAITAFSDVRLKEDIVRVGALKSGLPIYSYRFKGRPGRVIGVMAQEARLTHPHAVFEHPSGFLMVDYGALT